MKTKQKNFVCLYCDDALNCGRHLVKKKEELKKKKFSKLQRDKRVNELIEGFLKNEQLLLIHRQTLYSKVSTVHYIGEEKRAHVQSHIDLYDECKFF